MFVNDAAQNFRFLQAQFRFVGLGRGAARFQMRDDEGEGEIGFCLNFNFHKATADAETASVQKKTVIRVRMARDDGQPAQDGDVDVRVHTGDMFPKLKIQSVGLERRAEFEQCVCAAYFFECEHVGIQCANNFADFGLGLAGFDEAARFGRLIQIIFVVSGDAESFGGEGS